VVIGSEKPLRAMEIIKPGGPEVVRFAERDEPAPGPGQVTIRVEYAGLNFVDVLARRGVPGYFTGWPFVPGMEVGGTIHALGTFTGHGNAYQSPSAGFTGLCLPDDAARQGGRGRRGRSVTRRR
jgi:NADPH:quinone reductase-like Zn-dependent oxidoreductase